MKIFHISDLHIRNGDAVYSRYCEYMKCFHNFEQIVNEYVSKNDDLIVFVIAGDLFHNKNKIENYGGALFTLFINKCLKFGKIILIPGNHDFRLEYPDEPSLLRSFILDNENIFVMDETGNIVIDEIGFATVNIRDTLDNGNTTSIVTNLPEFPSEFKTDVKKKIAIFHGSFYNAKMNKDRLANDKQSTYPLEWLEKFDLALLGDIHMRQIKKFKNTWWAYPSSLIQQTFGEDPFKHGFIVWNIDEEISYECFDIYNEFTRLNIKFHNDNWNLVTDDGLIDIDEALNNSLFPKKPTIKIINGEPNELYKILKSKNIDYNVMNAIDNKNIDTVYDNVIDIFDINDKNYWFDYFKKTCPDNFQTIKKWISQPETFLLDSDNLPKDISMKFADKNKKLDKYIKDFSQTSDKDIQYFSNYKISYIKWDHLLCYGKGNYFNFRNGDNNVMVVNGKNATGKSSLFEIITYAIFGQTMASRTEGSVSCSFINKHKQSNQRAFTQVIVTINNIEYVINRAFDIDNNKPNYIQQRDIWLKTDNFKKTGATAVNNWVKDNIGTLNNFLFTSMITQSNDCNILEQKPKDQLISIDKFLRIENINSFVALIHQAELNYKYAVDTIGTIQSHIIDSVKIVDEEEYKQLERKKDLLFKKKQELYEDLNKYNYDDVKFNKEILAQDLYEKITGFENIDETQYEKYNTQKFKLIDCLDGYDHTKLVKAYDKTTKKHYKKLINETVEKPTHDKEYVINKLSELGNVVCPQKDIKTITKELDVNEKKLQTIYENIIPKPDYDEETIMKKLKSKPKQNIKEIKDTLSNYQKELSDLYDKKPSKPDLDEKSINKEIKSIGKVEKTNLTINDVNKKIKEEQTILNTLYENKPDGQYDKSFDLTKSLKNLKGIKNVSVLKEFVEKNQLTTISKRNIKNNENVFEIMSQNEEYKTLVETKQTNYNKLYETYNKLKDKQTNYIQELNGLSIVQKPKHTKKEIKEWFKEYETFVIDKPKYEKKLGAYEKFFDVFDNITLEIVKTHDKIQSLKDNLEEFENIEYNPKCSVCMKQPFIGKMQKLKEDVKLNEDLYEKLNKRLTKHVGKKNVDKDRNNYITCQEWIEYFDELTENKETYENELEQWNLYEPYKALLDAINDTSDDIKNIDIDKSLKELNVLKEKLNEIENKIVDIVSYAHIIYKQYVFNTFYDKCNIHKQSISDYEEILDTIDKQNRLIFLQDYIDKWSVYNEWNSQVENVKENIEVYSEYEEQYKYAEAYEAFQEIKKQNDTIEIIKKDIDKLNNDKQSVIEYNKVKDTLSAYSNLKEKWDLYDKWVASVNEYKAIIDAYELSLVNDNLQQINDKLFLIEAVKVKELYLKKSTFEKELLDVSKEYDKIQDEYINMSNDYSRMIEYNKETDKFKEISTKLNKEFVILKDLKGKINGFKDYVYNDVIISNICKRMNKFISTYSCSKFNVNATIIDNGITWNVIKDINDEEYFVPYIKCSGFEKFILSLALRLTIANFHKNTFKCEQLFIDEGFVAFDSNNLDKVPVMLNNLLGMYSSIIIVSHIDKLKDENYMNIDINNVGGVSKIMF